MDISSFITTIQQYAQSQNVITTVAGFDLQERYVVWVGAFVVAVILIWLVFFFAQWVVQLLVNAFSVKQLKTTIEQTNAKLLAEPETKAPQNQQPQKNEKKLEPNPLIDTSEHKRTLYDYVTPDTIRAEVLKQTINTDYPYQTLKPGDVAQPQPSATPIPAVSQMPVREPTPVAPAAQTAPVISKPPVPQTVPEPAATAVTPVAPQPAPIGVPPVPQPVITEPSLPTGPAAPKVQTPPAMKEPVLFQTPVIGFQQSVASAPRPAVPPLVQAAPVPAGTTPQPQAASLPPITPTPIISPVQKPDDLYNPNDPALP